MSGAGRFTASSATRRAVVAGGRQRDPGAVHRAGPRYTSPWRALAVAAAGFVLTVIAVMWPPFVAGWTPAALAAALVVLTMAPLAVAVVIAGSGARSRASPLRGVWRWSWSDLAAGACAGLGLRAAVEILTPTASQASGFVASTQAVAVTLVAAVVLAPIVEEAFFRGLVLGAVTDVLSRSIGRTASAVVAIAVSTAAFVALHAVAGGLRADLLLAATLTGIVCGTLAVLTGRIVAPIAAHVVFNGVGAALLLI
ncbi:type II CAAX endopeptidase family protein [Microbacterium sp. zg-YB36]|uniref:CPBP family intramembrane glutamic endopeptidase n=1 Tax=Microbacterium sp. zg-YB36 TaxID=2969407 RepID=UPI00214CD3AA|nr:type II CAAX endopeptidase family protein [Microbacterium sp. zg-YB36]MDL5352753.1 type II CAAX endopeptidase family protein [Microbacterium sp. zg-YB36]